MTRLDTELTHMLRLLTPTSFLLWKAYLWDKAKRLAESDPAEFKELPQLLTERAKSLPREAEKQQ